MIQMIEVQREDVLAFRIEGRIEKADIDALAEGVERRMKKYDRIRAYVEAGEITGIAVEAVFADLAFAFTHVWDVERKAVVSDDRWHRVILEFAEQLFPSVDARHFRPAERALALEWIQDGPDPRSLTVHAMDHVETLVPDLDAGIDWMERCFGLEEVEAFSGVGDEGGPVMLTSDDSYTKVALFRGEPAGFGPARGHRVVAFRTDARSFLRFLEYAPRVPVHQDDGTPLADGSRLEVEDHGVAVSVYFRDPWGNPFELTTYEVEPVREGLG
jgi:catechol 2,3-dioxygenase-like lactoylglutathione lyase family enzyme